MCLSVCVCVCLHASGLCIRVKEMVECACVGYVFMPRNGQVYVFVCFCVYVHPSEKFMPGNWI